MFPIIIVILKQVQDNNLGVFAIVTRP